jgi:hypothetical protein
MRWTVGCLGKRWFFSLPNCLLLHTKQQRITLTLWSRQSSLMTWNVVGMLCQRKQQQPMALQSLHRSWFKHTTIQSFLGPNRQNGMAGRIITFAYKMRMRIWICMPSGRQRKKISFQNTRIASLSILTKLVLWQAKAIYVSFGAPLERNTRRILQTAVSGLQLFQLDQELAWWVHASILPRERGWPWNQWRWITLHAYTRSP